MAANPESFPGGVAQRAIRHRCQYLRKRQEREAHMW
eukprot:CAMPEP_0194315616 /NCGR_PEP_ID=MMETSP0171-20130528/12412_1 /TAXON_ID=218684 /ORGANISM="Corethron pennatum, Strain L29A3" /LENGTH=35 /DNA_ID= /DNA_START= /DNA_END= /DNA_ORIENTATION=